MFLAIFGHFWPYKSSKTPDSESSHRADHFAPVISSRGRLGLEIRTKIGSSRFRPILGGFLAYNLPKPPDLECSHRADHFAPVITSRGLLGLEIQPNACSLVFLQSSHAFVLFATMFFYPACFSKPFTRGRCLRVLGLNAKPCPLATCRRGRAAGRVPGGHRAPASGRVGWRHAVTPRSMYPKGWLAAGGQCSPRSSSVPQTTPRYPKIPQGTSG